MAVQIAVWDATLRAELAALVGGLDWQLVDFSHPEKADLVFAPEAEAQALVEHCTEKSTENRRPTIFVTVTEKSAELPKLYLEGQADDILVVPVRRHEFLSRVRWHFHLQHLRELEKTTAGVPELVEKLEEDLVLAEKIQRRLIRDKFPPLSGLSIKSKYWCGMRSGGDYFDVVDFPGSQYVGFLLTDSSSYSLSSSLLGALMHQSFQVTNGERPQPEELAAKILGQVQMGDKDILSLFLGILDRKTFRLNFISAGGTWACRRDQEGQLEWICRGERKPLSSSQKIVAPAQEIALQPEDRLLLLSDGWGEGIPQWPEFLEKELQKGLDSQSFVNQLSFRLGQANGGEADDLPPQDCSALVVDIDKHVLRLA